MTVRHMVSPPFDPRLAPLIALRRLILLPEHDREEREERRELHKITIREAIRK